MTQRSHRSISTSRWKSSFNSIRPPPPFGWSNGAVLRFFNTRPDSLSRKSRTTDLADESDVLTSRLHCVMLTLIRCDVGRKDKPKRMAPFSSALKMSINRLRRTVDSPADGERSWLLIPPSSHPARKSNSRKSIRLSPKTVVPTNLSLSSTLTTNWQSWENIFWKSIEKEEHQSFELFKTVIRLIARWIIVEYSPLVVSSAYR